LAQAGHSRRVESSTCGDVKTETTRTETFLRKDAQAILTVCRQSGTFQKLGPRII
jgi:hypothetical protein